MNSIGEQRMELMQKLNIEVKCPSPSSPISSEYKCTRPRGGMQQKHGNVNDTSRVPGCATEISIPNRPREESLGLKHYFEGKRMHNRAQTRSIRPHSAESHHSQHSMMPEGSLLRSYRGEINKPPEICSELDGKRQLLEPRQFETSSSRIFDLPVGPFMRAAKEGWSTYFRHPHSTACYRQSKNKGSSWGSPVVDKRRQWRVQRRSPAPMPTTRNRSSFSREYRRRPLSSHKNSLSSDRTRLHQAIGVDDIRRMAIRLQILWHEMKIPHPDQAYIMATCFEAGEGRESRCTLEKDMPLRADVRREMVRQISILLRYRADTIKVLHSVERRESRLSEVKRALHSFHWHRGYDTDAEGLITSLAGLRDASRAVIKAIVAWRGNLWQPWAFCWRGENYLKRMFGDSAFLRSPLGEGLLRSVGLTASDMRFILFPTPEVDQINPSNRSGKAVEAMNVQQSSNTAQLTPRPELVVEYRTQFFHVAPSTVPGTSETIVDTADSCEAREEINVVLCEADRQENLADERIQLASKGRFVPLLRWLPISDKFCYTQEHPPEIDSRDSQGMDDRPSTAISGYTEKHRKAKNSKKFGGCHARMPWMASDSQENPTGETGNRDRRESAAEGERVDISNSDEGQGGTTRHHYESLGQDVHDGIVKDVRHGKHHDKLTHSSRTAMTEQRCSSPHPHPDIEEIEPAPQETYHEIEQLDTCTTQERRYITDKRLVDQEPEISKVDAREPARRGKDTFHGAGSQDQQRINQSLVIGVHDEERIHSSRTPTDPIKISDETATMALNEAFRGEIQQSEEHEFLSTEGPCEIKHPLDSIQKTEDSKPPFTCSNAGVKGVFPHEEHSGSLSDVKEGRSIRSLLYDDDFDKCTIGSTSTSCASFLEEEHETPDTDVTDDVRDAYALAIQRAWRRKAAVSYAALIRRRCEEEIRAIAKIHKAMRSAKAYWIWRRGKTEREESATKIQALARQMAGERLAQVKKSERNATVTVQSYARRNLESFKLQGTHRHHHTRKVDAALGVQTLAQEETFSQEAGKGNVNSKDMLEEGTSELVRSATKIQAFLRRKAAEQEGNRRRLEKAKRITDKTTQIIEEEYEDNGPRKDISDAGKIDSSRGVRYALLSTRQSSLGSLSSNDLKDSLSSEGSSGCADETPCGDRDNTCRQGDKRTECVECDGGSDIGKLELATTEVTHEYLEGILAPTEESPQSNPRSENGLGSLDGDNTAECSIAALAPVLEGRISDESSYDSDYLDFENFSDSSKSNLGK